jgi:hypothetical protein
MNRNTMGLTLIIIGSVIILNSIDLFYFEDLIYMIDLGNNWPYILVLFGLIFWVRFFKDTEDYELIMPATILTSFGTIFILFNYSDYTFLIWPYFILAPALGLWLMQLSPYRKKDHSIAAVILTCVGFYFIGTQEFDFVGPGTLFGLMILVVGFVIVLRKRA